MKRNLTIYLFSVICISVFFGCASYGAGGLYNSGDRTEFGGYIFANSKYTETTISYAADTDSDTQSLGAGLSLKYPIPIGKISLFPLVNFEYQYILGQTEDYCHLGWVRFGGGLDFSITNALYLRSEFAYAPNMFSFLPEMDKIGLNPSAGYSVRLGLGWRPGVSNSSKQNKPAAKTSTQTKTTQPPSSSSQTKTTQSTQPPSSSQTRDPRAPRYLIEYDAQTMAYLMSKEYKNAVRKEFYRILNEHRRAHGLRELKINTELEVYADVRAAELRSIFGHTRPDGTAAGSGWHNMQNYMDSRYAENAQGTIHLDPDPLFYARCIFEGWKNSPGHNRHMLYEFSPQITMALGFVPERSDYIDGKFVRSANGKYVSSGAIFATGW